MGWSLGFDSNWNRDIGYGVPAYCDHPDCKRVIDRGLAYVCGSEPYGGEHGCGLYFCSKHRPFAKDHGRRCSEVCVKCHSGQDPFPPKPEHPRWIRHKLKHKSWQEWRDENPEEVAALKSQLPQRTDHE